MKLHFDSKQEFQIEAVKAITGIFEEQPLSDGDFKFSMNQAGILLTENGFGNREQVNVFLDGDVMKHLTQIF